MGHDVLPNVIPPPPTPIVATPLMLPMYISAAAAPPSIHNWAVPGSLDTDTPADRRPNLAAYTVAELSPAVPLPIAREPAARREILVSTVAELPPNLS